MKKPLFACTVLALPVVASAPPPMPAYAATPVNHLEDLSAFEATAADTLALVNKGAYTRLRPSSDTWGVIDDAADAAIAALRDKKPVAAETKTAVTSLIAALQKPSVK